MQIVEKLKAQLKHWQFTLNLQQAFLADIASLVEDGVPARQAIQTVAKIKHDVSKDLAIIILHKLAEGQHIADGMRGWFPNYIVELIRVGELGGTLPGSLRSAADMLSQKQGVLTSVLNSILYPLVVVIAAMVVMVFINHSVFSIYANIHPIIDWPANGRHLYEFSNIIQHWGWFVPLLVIAIIYAVRKLLHDYIGEGRKVIDNIPGLALYRKLMAARFMETLGFLISNGMVFKTALKIMQYDANPYLASHMLIMEYRLGGGKDNIADVLDTGLIEKADIDRLRVIAKGKGFEYALVRQGQRALEQSTKSLRIFGRGLGFLLLACGAFFAIFIILSMYDVGSFIGTTG